MRKQNMHINLFIENIFKKLTKQTYYFTDNSY